MRTAVLVFLLLLLGACGQSGDLYLPEESAPAATPSIPAPDAPPQDKPAGEKEKNPAVEQVP